VAWAILAGCAGPSQRADQQALRSRALDGLKRATSYEELASVRAQAVEALQESAPAEGLPWIRKALGDESPAVRFAACAALGMLRDKTSMPLIEQRVADPDASVQVAAIFALHRSGDVRFSNRFPEFLLDHPQPAVRRNTAMLLGRLGEKGAVALLARAMSASDAALRLEALEAMARLGGEEAISQLKFAAHSGAGAEETLAVLAIGETADPAHADLYRFKLEKAQHWETRLAAARALGRLGHADGYELALSGLSFSTPDTKAADDPPEHQILRVKQLAASALAAIGKPDAVPALAQVMQNDPDPRVQLAAAKAVLDLTSPAARRKPTPSALSRR
jgi:HEAT repeat protein